MKKLVVPKFATEAEEAKWWDEHMDAVGENLIDALKSGQRIGAARGACFKSVASRETSPSVCR